MPRVVVWRKSREAIFSRSSRRHSTVSITPGRLFFMQMGVVKASRAPAARSSSRAKPMPSGVMSSRLQESSATWSWGSSLVWPSMARRPFMASKSFVPMPMPTCSTAITGAGPKDVTKCLSRAAPVGVHSSPCTAPP